MTAFCPAQTLRLDRTKPLICSAAELIPFQASPERNFKQSSPSASGGSHLFGKCGALTYAIRDAEAVSLLCTAALKKETAASRSQSHRLNKDAALPQIFQNNLRSCS
jgi:hypothetical protein